MFLEREDKSGQKLVLSLEFNQRNWIHLLKQGKCLFILFFNVDNLIIMSK
jgi:hypothetical protein